MKRNIFGLAMLVTVLAFTMAVVTGCKEPEPGVEDGNLSGTSWKLAPGQGQARTTIFNFTDGNNSHITTVEDGSRTSYYTYVYSHELKTGTMERKSDSANWWLVFCPKQNEAPAVWIFQSKIK